MLTNHKPLQRLVALSILIITMLSGCRSSKQMTTGGETLTLKTERDFYAALQAQSFRYQTFSARVQFEIMLSSGKEASARAQLTIQRNDQMQISVLVPVLGIEAFRAELTPDSIKVVDRLNRRFLMESIDGMKGNTAIDFNFYNLQALFTNRLFLPGETETDFSADQFSRFRWEQTHTGYLLRIGDRTGMNYAFTADQDEKLSATEIRDESSNYTLYCNYETFRPVDRQLFPMNIHFRLYTENNTQGTLSLAFSRVEVDVPLAMNFPVPANYRRVSLQEILYSIEQL